MSSFADQEIQGYKVQKAIGEGKFSTVYKATNPEGVTIALKKIKIFDMMDPKQREKCMKEVKLMQPLDHPHIIKYLDSFIYNNELIIATEWAERGDLKRLIKCAQQDDTPFEEVALWAYILQISSALAHMHDKRIMHRDLKPANIFIASDGTLKVGDLGLGRIFSSETIEAYSKVGTPLYMSPELLQGEGYDMKPDVWSLGCIIYEMCEFKSPFRQNEKMSLMDLFNNITKGSFKEISARYSHALRDLINEMIVVDPTKRIDASAVQLRAKHNYTELSEQKQQPQIYNILVMEDIYEKLGLVQYHEYFCTPLKKPPVSKYYFAIDDGIPQTQKFYYFAELCYWLMSLPKQKKKQAASPTKMNYSNIEETAKKLLNDIKQWGVKLPDQLGWNQIINGCGDMVCFILNDLLNRELIRINFKFNAPKFGDNIEPAFVEQPNNMDDGEMQEVDMEVDDQNDSVELDIMQQSIIFYQKKFNAEYYDYNSVPADKAVLETQVATTEWQKEYLRAEKELTKFEISLNVNRTYLKDYQKSIIAINKSSQLYSQCSKYFKSEATQQIQQNWIEQLEAIPKLEQRLTEALPHESKQQIIDQRIQLSDIKLKCEVLQRDVATKMQIDQHLETKLQQIQSQSPTLEDRRPKIREIIGQLKDEIKGMNIRIGFLQTTLLQQQHNQSNKTEDVEDWLE